ncbi:hypothetical protein RA210_U70124 [Rubrivivax sp. A210]|nr:hypothetical protein RA210_U70124 [Rubrivivax sp. A210]
MAQGRCQSALQRREHGLEFPGSEGHPGLCGEHAHVLPDEASLIRVPARAFLARHHRGL